MAEMVHHYFPKLVELHNYSAAHNTMQKMYNWNTLNTKVCVAAEREEPNEVFVCVLPTVN